MLKWAQVIAVFVCSGALAFQASAPERQVNGNIISSKRDPQVRIQLPKSAQYVGADRWILYDMADCELHAFIEADEQKNVERLYWVQFEGYLSSKPELAHTYDSPRHAQLGSMDFYVDTWVRASNDVVQSGSDRQHIEALISARGYKMPAGMMYVRLVHLLDAAKRKELMIIYGEDLGPSGFTADDLQENGRGRERWPSIEQALIARAEQKIAVEDLPNP